VKRRTVFALPLLASGLAAGCTALGGNPEPRHWYRLEDLGAAPASAATRSERVLLVEVVTASALHEGTALVFSRRPGAFAHYRFANWTEPPARSLGRLVERRLEARGGFRAVGASTSGLRGELLLRVALEELLHDAAVEPGAGRIAVDAELLDWARRTRVARRRFARSAPADAANATGAASAISRALTDLLDELAPWVEGAAR
jgi:ABC-type uncharacterized transport system auxiliary subunit